MMSNYSKGQPISPEELEGRSPLLRFIIDLEPAVLDVLQRAYERETYCSRWAAYSALKEACRELVGWQAREVQLREPHYHEDVMAAVDVLLPTSEEWGRHASVQALYPGEKEEGEC
jgi:hypothetical protein